jgi:hypothetical protein
MLFADGFFLPWWFFIILLAPIWCGAILLVVIYVSILYRTVTLMAPDNRPFAPGLVWLFFVPVVNLGWFFFVIFSLSKSLTTEYRTRQLKPFDRSFGFDIGLALLFFSLVGIIAVPVLVTTTANREASFVWPLMILCAVFALGMIGHAVILSRAQDDMRE